MQQYQQWYHEPSGNHKELLHDKVDEAMCLGTRSGNNIKPGNSF
ncbi:unnamed protein product [marine sediment metagenome]|uniref:Uncharacterized protein n=1 Tax=marine sediment metagenome TaxID=412755 RepID=X1J1D1_9ZZZZ